MNTASENKKKSKAEFRIKELLLLRLMTLMIAHVYYVALAVL